MPYYAELCPAMLGVTYSNGRGGRSIVSVCAVGSGVGIVLVLISIASHLVLVLVNKTNEEQNLVN